MSQITRRGEELIRICPCDKINIEYSTNGGKCWHIKYRGTAYGEFLSQTDNGDEILAITSTGLYYSVNNGRKWYKRS